MLKKLLVVSALMLGLFLSFAAAAESLECGLCGGPITESSNRFVIVDSEEGQQEFGCPGCGLAVLSLMPPEQYSAARVQDFLSRKMIDAVSAWYLRGTEVGFCCQPNWLAFSSKDDATNFAKGFGGDVHDFASAIKLAPGDHDHSHGEKHAH